MKRSPENLLIYTAAFPFGTGESFLLPELSFSKKCFEKVQIVPFSTKGTVREMNEAIEVITDLDVSRDTVLSFRNRLLILRILLIDLFVSGDPLSLSVIRNKYSLLKKAAGICVQLEKRFLVEQYLHYSYWMNDWALALMILKYKRKDTSYVFRMLGYEVWEDRWPHKVVPFRKLLIKNASGVFPNSRVSAGHLVDLGLKGNIQAAWLGNEDHGMAPLPVDVEPVRILSCSALIPLKRVELIAEVLVKWGKKVKWVHVGEGSEQDKVLKVVKGSADLVTLELVDRVDDLADYFLKNPFHLFIHLSSTEGLPVVVQEAISFGIPVLATDAGGTGEVVTGESGKLIPVDFSPDQPIFALDELLMPHWQNEEARNRIRQFWVNNFWSGKVYPDFYSTIKNQES